MTTNDTTDMAAHTTTITLTAPDAHSVFVAGSFNDWSRVTHPMERAPDGQWELILDLPPGRHEYKFVIDGQWCCEPGCDGPHVGCEGCCPNAFGTMNRVIEVPSHVL